MEDLNNLESAILKRISDKYIEIKSHIPFVKVDFREYTGVGMYIHLIYINSSNKLLKLNLRDSSISTNESIIMAELGLGLIFELNTTGGFLDYIELVTYDEKWDGKISNNFHFIKN